MARTIKAKKIDSPTARAKLKRGREPHWEALTTGKAHLGYQRPDGSREGRWLLRQHLGGGKYSVQGLGRADDAAAADGESVFSHDQAKGRAQEIVTRSKEGVASGPLTVRQTFARYLEYLDQQGKSTVFTRQRGDAVILPKLGDLLVADLTSDRLRKWLADLAASPALLRSKKGSKKQNTKPTPEDEEAIRKRRSTANRILTMVKAALNHAYDEKLVASNDAWSRRLKPFRGVDEARLRYLQINEATRLLNAAAGLKRFPGFDSLLQAALQTGCRYGELCRLRVEDFNRDAGTLAIRKTKSQKARHVILTPEGAAFFAQETVGRPGTDVLLMNQGRLNRLPKGKNDDLGEWRASEQNRPMLEACKQAKIEPLGIHAMRHTYASHCVMNGTPLIVVARNLGHKDTRMVERHYGHLAPDYVREAIHAGAPRFGFVPNKKVVGLIAAE